MSRDFFEMLETTTPTDEVMAVDMPYLEAYLRGGSAELQRLQAQEELEPDHEPESGSPEHKRGGAGGDSGSSAAAEMIPGSPHADSTVEAAPLLETLTDAGGEIAVDDQAVISAGLDLETEPETPASLQLTDHQEAVQSAASTKGGSGGADDTAVLPQSGFRLSGVKSQPHIKSLPDSIVSELREQLRSAAVRELGVSDAAAREFSQRLSQGTLVTAFLLAQLDLRVDADAATQRAAELFRSRDPLLGSVAARLEGFEAAERERNGLLRSLRDELAEVRQTGAAVEQAVAYSIADRTKNFLRGVHNIHDAPITHKDALFVRDRVREATRKQAKAERERDGRPIR